MAKVRSRRSGNHTSEALRRRQGGCPMDVTSPDRVWEGSNGNGAPFFCSFLRLFILYYYGVRDIIV